MNNLRSIKYGCFWGGMWRKWKMRNFSFFSIWSSSIFCPCLSSSAFLGGWPLWFTTPISPLHPWTCARSKYHLAGGEGIFASALPALWPVSLLPSVPFASPDFHQTGLNRSLQALHKIRKLYITHVYFHFFIWSTIKTDFWRSWPLRYI